MTKFTQGIQSWSQKLWFLKTIVLFWQIKIFKITKMGRPLKLEKNKESAHRNSLQFQIPSQKRQIEPEIHNPQPTIRWETEFGAKYLLNFRYNIFTRTPHFFRFLNKSFSEFLIFDFRFEFLGVDPVLCTKFH